MIDKPRSLGQMLFEVLWEHQELNLRTLALWHDQPKLVQDAYQECAGVIADEVRKPCPECGRSMQHKPDCSERGTP